MSKVLFLCTGNACRSQIAEGFLRTLGQNRYRAESAGIDPKGVHPRAIQVMVEIGVDISSQDSTDLDSVDLENVDILISVCDRTRESCPVLPSGIRRLHWSFEDPAEAAGTEEEILSVFRRVREEIRTAVEAFLEEA